VISQFPQSGVEIVYISVQSKTNKQTPDLLFRLFFPLPLQSLDRLSSTENEGKNKQTKQQKKQAEKQSKKKLQNPNPTLAHILRGWRNGIKYRRKKKKKLRANKNRTANLSDERSAGRKWRARGARR
jgi:hypothetical protein